MNILFGLNRNSDAIIERKILDNYSKKTDLEFNIFREYDLYSISKKLTEETIDYLILNEELERDNLVDINYLDDLSDRHSSLKIILIVNESHKNDDFIRKLFGIGIYNVIFSNELTIEKIVDLVISPRNKKEGKIYLGIGDVESIIVEGDTLISDYEINNIINHLRTISDDRYENAVKHISRQYNDKENKFLFKNLPRDIKIKWLSYIEEDFKILLDIESIDRNIDNEFQGEYIEESDTDPIEDKHFNDQKINEKRTIKDVINRKDKVITKTKKEYVNVFPNDYKKVIAITGERKVGKTTMTYLLSNLYSKSKRVVVLDFTENGLFNNKAWGSQDVKIQNDIKTLQLSENLSVIKSIENVNVMDLIEQYKYQNDIIIIEANLDFPINVLKWTDEIIYLSTLDIMDVWVSKEYLRNAMLQGVNMRKVHLVINKYIKSKVSPKDIFNLHIEPIPYMEKEGEGIEISDKYFIIPFDMEYYKDYISSSIYVDNNPKITSSIELALNEIANVIYPIGIKKNKSIFNKINIFKKEF